MRAAFYTLGCKVNQYETQAIMQQFADNGFTVVEWEDEADVYIVNSCTVTSTGDKKSRQMLSRARRRSPNAIIALCGCFPQAFPDAAAKIVEADIVVGSKNRAGLLDAVRRRLNAASADKFVDIPGHEAGEPFEPLRIDDFSGHTRAFVKIQDGCERYCAYCIIPKARGPIRSKPLTQLAGELGLLAESGYKEVVLVGINLSSYGLDLGNRLVDAVTLACGISGIGRVRLGSLEPELLTDEDIEALSKLPGFCPSFHLSLQSGCDETLRRMRRHYDTAEYRRIVGELRRVFPGCAVTTDIMVGFPGETEQEFAASVAFVEEIGFARVHVFAYSPRDGTAAAEMPGQIPAAEKSRRAALMAQAASRSAEEFNKSMIGKKVKVLFEAQVNTGMWEGYSENYTQVILHSNKSLEGQILTVTVIEANGERVVAEE